MKAQSVSAPSYRRIAVEDTLETICARAVMTSTLDTIIIVSDHAYVSGGNAQVGLASAIALANVGIRVIVFAAVGPIDPRLIGVDNLEVVCLHLSEAKGQGNIIAGAIQGLWNEAAAIRCKRLLMELDPDRTVIHVHSWTKSLSSSVLRAASTARFRVVMTLHDYFSICPNGSYYLYNEERTCTIRPMSLKCVATNCDPRNYGEKLYRVGRQVVTSNLGGLPKRIRHYISISPLIRATIEPYLPRGVQIYDVANPVTSLKSNAANVRHNVNYLYIGRLSKEKGPHLFLEAAAQARVKAVVVGDGSEQSALIRQYPDATFTGWLTPEETGKQLRSARALVMPSMWEEPFGLVALEALAAGVPAVMPIDSGASHHVVHGFNGLLFKRASTADLADMLRALKSDDYVEALGHAAYIRYWESPFSIQRHVTDLLRVYDKVIAE